MVAELSLASLELRAARNGESCETALPKVRRRSETDARCDAAVKQHAVKRSTRGATSSNS